MVGRRGWAGGGGVGGVGVGLVGFVTMARRVKELLKRGGGALDD